MLPTPLLLVQRTIRGISDSSLPTLDPRSEWDDLELKEAEEMAVEMLIIASLSMEDESLVAVVIAESEL